MKQIDLIPDLISQVDKDELFSDLFYLSKELPFRKINYTLPNHTKNSLYEADDYIAGRLESWGYTVEREGCQAQAFRRDTSKPIRSQFSSPTPEDPWHTLYNLYARKVGKVHPERIIVFISHKDSQSWIDSPGAYDNTVGTIANMQIARILRDYPSQNSIRHIFCNEEHTPWTSVIAAKKAKERNDNIIAVFNLDGLGGKSQEDIDAGNRTNVTLFTAPEGERIADIVTEANEKYQIRLMQRKHQRTSPGDDDGSYINAGFPVAVANIGSFPYMDPNYHAENDTPENVDMENVYMSTRLSLAAAVMFDLLAEDK